MLYREGYVSSTGEVGGDTTRCSVDRIISFDHLCKRSPALTTTVSEIGVAGTNLPSGDKTSRPPLSSWNKRVMDP